MVHLIFLNYHFSGNLATLAGQGLAPVRLILQLVLGEFGN